MKLAYSPISPFARKVRIAAIELGLDARIELVPEHLMPHEDNSGYQKSVNPLGKIPALTLADGRVLVDSLVICEYLDALAGGGKLLPASGDARFDVLSQHAVASGMGDALVLVRYEDVLRPEALRWAEWRAGQLRKVSAGLDYFETQGFEAQLSKSTSAGEPDLAQYALACTLGYADFRFPQLDWRAGRPALANWYAQITARPSFVATAPK